ncbi:hypothetical protein QYF48_12240 [Brevibacillus agri]|uniref:hypothetical protein n=1 Tax=Brevibacillus agri TaxID=51101 RepID=UPI0025B656FF|nr:hypothetical protein [Brevibacillus agri]MDN4093585.1 hypothetical protein [Brevibacillus agri]
MSYAKTQWQDRFVDPVTSEITNGTAITATRMNNIEQGIYDAHVLLDQHSAAISNLQNRMNTMESTLPENFVHNNYNDDLSTLSLIKVIRGYYNEAQSRLEV